MLLVSAQWASENKERPAVLRCPLPTSVARRWFDETPRIRSAGTRKIWLGHLKRLELRNPDKPVNEYLGEILDQGRGAIPRKR